MTLSEYLKMVGEDYARGNATEHTYRGYLQQLIESLMPHVKATNEPKRQKCGAPDYILTQKGRGAEIPVGFIEAKDIGDKDLKGEKTKGGNKEQFDRYKNSLGNIIFTDYIDFLFYQDGALVARVQIGEVVGKTVKPLPENFATFTNLIHDFASYVGQTITSSAKLAKMMAGKARLMADVIERAVISDEETQENSSLQEQMQAFKEVLIHDITPKSFADVYAQTVVYGMFAARLHDTDLSTFTRQKAANLIPKSNPFLRKFFQYIAGFDLDDRLVWIVDNLVEIFLACDVHNLLKDYGKNTETEDAIIHFYETFLSEYDAELRKARGVWYTPAPVVNFIVRAVDDILKSEFGLAKGLADNSKTHTKIRLHENDKRYTKDKPFLEEEIHRVQILDPATGTGTFLAEVIKHVHQKFKGQQGIWNSYVEQDLLPRLNGFELLMASYAMAHLQLDLLLSETGYKSATNQRLRVYLTNSLEEPQDAQFKLAMAQWLSDEGKEADKIKRETPVMCIIGNPPYSGESANKGEWIMRLMEDYKKEPDNKGKLQERNSKTINDDYVKFLRYGQYLIEKNGSGVLAFINPHGFLDNITYRGMRWHLLKTYDKIYTIDLHGNSKKKETAPDGSADQNVFDIMQGVSINLFIKTGKKKADELGKVFHFDLFGKREYKYDFLFQNSIKKIPYNEVQISAPNFFFVSKNNKGDEEYNNGFSVYSLFPISTSGIKTHSDSTLVSFKKYDSYNQQYNYRPFDIRNIEYDLTKVQRHRYSVMEHMLKDNLSIMTSRQLSTFDFQHILVSKYLVDMCSISLQTKETTYAFPLYLYPTAQRIIGQSDTRTPNLDEKIVAQIAAGLGLTFTPEKTPPSGLEGTFAPIDLLDYIYAVLHSPTYRETYKEFLKIDFPRVPYPTDAGKFWELVRLGGELRQIHLLESDTVENYITQYPISGTNTVGKIKYEQGKVWINETQYFDGVPQAAWEFYIGGYQPAQKWLKDRKERALDFDDILHYQKIIVALTETERLMREIDAIGV